MVRGMETLSRFWRQFIATVGGIAALIAFVGSDFERQQLAQPPHAELTMSLNPTCSNSYEHSRIRVS